MTLSRISLPRWLVLSVIVVSLVALVACGASAPEPAPAVPAAGEAPAAASAAPSQPAQPAQPAEPMTRSEPAAAPEPAQPEPQATVSAVVGQGAIGVGAKEATATPAPTAVPAAVAETPAEPAISQLRVSRGPTTRDLADPIAGRGDLPVILPMFEGLVQFDQYTDSVSMLAPEWSANDDFTVWTFKLREGVQFHKDWGEMTAKDVEHTMWQERRNDHFDGRAATWRDLLREVVMPDGPEGHVVELHLNKPEPIMTTYMSTNYTTVIRSKDHWDANGGVMTGFEANDAGIKLMANDPIGTGPYQFAEHAEAQYLRYEQPAVTHWRKTPDFPELRINFVAEPSTQLAQLVTGEVHAAEIPRDLQVGALSRGMVVVLGTTPAIRLVGFFGGNYLPDNPNFDASEPMTIPLVREAMNRAIDRQEINDVFFNGRAELMMQTHSHAKFPGWQPSWLDTFEADYGYDPEKAKAQLAEAGFPEGFEITQLSYPRPGLPEMLDIAELVADYWREIGIEVDFQPVETAVYSSKLRAKEVNNTAWLHTGSFTEPTRAIFVYHYSGARSPRYESPFFTEKYEALEIAATTEERDDLIREMGENCYEVYCSIPLHWVPFEFMINPEIIEEWLTPGVFGVRDFEYVKAVK
ncbi:MAG: ABC transporter substrate-binding protein [Chloroflexi bacterium]|nr:ABC transporter substrate-binding protein [Chloroflexota bacterium]